MNTEKLKELDKKYIWHPFTQMKDWMEEDFLIIEKGEGNYIYDTDGKKYFDAIASLWVNVHGHCHPHITKAIKEQAEKVAHTTLLGSSNVPAILLAEKLAQITPEGLCKVFYSDSGSTSVEIALKMAYQFWVQQEKPQPEKRKFITFKNAYHGDTIGSVSVGGTDLFHSKHKPLLFENIHLAYPYLSDNNDKNTQQKYINEFEQVIKENISSLAGIIIEPLVQGASGMLTAFPGALKAIRTLCTKYDLVMIVDEVATGFGRTGKMFACEHEDVQPDILCCAKGITGGYVPLAATITTQKIYDAFYGDYQEKKTFFHGHSYTGNQIACASALANLEVFEQEKTIENLQEKIELLHNLLETRINTQKHVKEVRKAGIMVGIELIKDKEHNIDYNWEEKVGIKVCKEMTFRGFLSRPLGNVIVVMLPLSVTKDEIQKIIKNLEESIYMITEAKK